ncbi:MAG: hypothetical protein GY754_33625 [bacterium]|nr:hypothetical protein [bacterium]
MKKPFTIAIFEAQNFLLEFDPPTIYDMSKQRWNSLADFAKIFFHGRGLYSKRKNKFATPMSPMQGSLFAANLLNQQEGVSATVYIPGISEKASTLTGVTELIKESDCVIVTALTIHSWAQKVIIAMAREMNKTVIATGPHTRMVESASDVLRKGKMPRVRNNVYNDDLDEFPGAQYVLQHDQYNAVLQLVDLIRSGKETSARLKKINGLGYVNKNSIMGLEKKAGNMIIPEIPDIVFNPTVIDNYEKISTYCFTGSEQGCLNNCSFCQVKEIMRNNFHYIPCDRLFQNFEVLLNMGFLKKDKSYQPLLNPLDYSIFITDDSPIIGGAIEKDIPFDYIEFTKVLDYIDHLKNKKNKKKKKFKKTHELIIPKPVFDFIQKRNRNILLRLEDLGLPYTTGGELIFKNVSPQNPGSLDQAVESLQLVLRTELRDPEFRPFASREIENPDKAELMGREIRCNYIEFTRMIDEMDRFKKTYNCSPGFALEISARALIFVYRYNFYLLKRMHGVGFDMNQVGYEDILSSDNSTVAGMVKSSLEENAEAARALHEAGITNLAMLVCSTDNYNLGDAKKMAKQALKLGVNAVQIFAEMAQEGTRATRRHNEKKRCLNHIAPELFDEPWRNLAYCFEKGEYVTTKPEHSSMLGMQLDILDALTYFNKIHRHIPLMLKGYFNKGFRTSSVAFGFPVIFQSSLTKDIKNWLTSEPVRNGKSYIQLLAEMDDRWKHEDYTLKLVKKFGLNNMLN